jgi:hypothetical protein
VQALHAWIVSYLPLSYLRVFPASRLRIRPAVDAGELPWVFFSRSLYVILMEEVLSNLTQLLINFPSSITKPAIRTLEPTKPFCFFLDGGFTYMS